VGWAGRNLDGMLMELITALTVVAGPVQAPAPRDLTGVGALVDDHVVAVMAEEKIPGVAVTVVAGGERVVHKG
jgi:hypothetical protein